MEKGEERSLHVCGGSSWVETELISVKDFDNSGKVLILRKNDWKTHDLGVN